MSADDAVAMRANHLRVERADLKAVCERIGDLDDKIRALHRQRDAQVEYRGHVKARIEALEAKS